MVGQAGAAQEERPKQGCLGERWGQCQGRVFSISPRKNKPQPSALVQSLPCYWAVYYSRFFSIPEQHQRDH